MESGKGIQIAVTEAPDLACSDGVELFERKLYTQHRNESPQNIEVTQGHEDHRQPLISVCKFNERHDRYQVSSTVIVE